MKVQAFNVGPNRVTVTGYKCDACGILLGYEQVFVVDRRWRKSRQLCPRHALEYGDRAYFLAPYKRPATAGESSNDK